MSTPTATSLPDGWTFTDSNDTTATAPDGSTATGAVLTEVLALVKQVATLQAGGTGGNPGTGSGPTQAAFDALTAQVTALTTAQTQQNVLAVAMQAALSLDETTLKSEPTTILSALAAAIQAAELPAPIPPVTSTPPVVAPPAPGTA